MQPGAVRQNAYFPLKKWKQTSGTPQCNNPNCCSRQQKEKTESTRVDGSKAREKCVGEKHNKHCCHAEGNVACSPNEWRILYSQVEPSRKDMARREWLSKWLSGQCSLNDALKGFHEEWGETEVELMEAA